MQVYVTILGFLVLDLSCHNKIYLLVRVYIS
jgi:hypothetical protein